ncbi:TetR/AcrR family transcriptional regulator [Limnohabitans sp. 2KL-1]|uniref:TetR/AcrR family transcriptional regulator n=1 Tax=Limnohabitans sp. 2KL-1 TaxID=1100699 RepID=UPI001304FD6B|nr:TetR/AcrR family transcriptional regulator [Limnohabitans sp. 2KL-1]
MATRTVRKTELKIPLQTSAATSRGGDRQLQLLEIACRLFSERGFNGTSLRDIAEEAKVTKAALYYHFPNKEALFAKIVLESLEALLNRVRESCAQVDSPEDKVRVFMLTTADNYQQNREAWIASSNAFRTHEESESKAKALELRDQYEKLLRGFIQEGIRAGHFRAVDPSMAGRVLLASINSMSRWHKPQGKLSASGVVEQFVDIVLGGLRHH